MGTLVENAHNNKPDEGASAPNASDDSGSSSKSGRTLDMDDESGEVSFILAIDKETYVKLETHTSIGTSDSADLVIKNGTISPVHCKFYIYDRNLHFMDMGSKSGSKINGKSIPLGKLVQVIPEDKIRIGEVALEMYLQMPLLLEKVVKKEKDKVAAPSKDPLKPVHRSKPVKEFDPVEWLSNLIKNWLKKLFSKLNPFKKKKEVPAKEAEKVKVKVEVEVKLSRFRRLINFIRKILRLKSKGPAGEGNGAIPALDPKATVAEVKVEKKKIGLVGRFLSFFKKILRRNKKETVGITATTALVKKLYWKRAFSLLKRVIFFWRKKEQGPASSSSDVTAVDKSALTDTTGKASELKKNIEDKKLSEEKKASSVKSYIKNILKNVTGIGKSKASVPKEEITVKINRQLAGPWNRLYALMADLAVSYAISIYLFESSPWKEELSTLRPQLMELLAPYVEEISSLIAKIRGLEEFKSVIELQEFKDLKNILENQLVKDILEASMLKELMTSQLVMDIKEFPFASFFSENFPFIISFAALNSASHILFGVSFSMFFLGLKGSGSFLSNRILGFFRMVMGWLLAPFIIFDLPCLFKRRTFKEVFTRNYLLPGEGLLKFSGSFLMLPLFISTLLFLPVIKNIPNISWEESAPPITIPEIAKRKKKDVVPPAPQDSSSVLYSESLNSGLDTGPLKDALLIPHLETKARGDTRSQLLIYHQNTASLTIFTPLPSFDFLAEIQKHEEHNFILGQFFPQLELVIQSYNGEEKTNKNRNKKNAPRKAKKIQVIDPLIEEFQDYILSALNFHWERLDEFALKFGPFWQGPLYMRKDLYEYLQATGPLNVEIKKIGDYHYLVHKEKKAYSKGAPPGEIITLVPLVLNPMNSIQIEIKSEEKKAPLNLAFSMSLLKGRGPEDFSIQIESTPITGRAAGRGILQTGDYQAVAQLAVFIFDQFSRNEAGPYTPELWMKDTQLLLETYHKMAVAKNDEFLDKILKKEIPNYIKIYRTIYQQNNGPQNKLKESVAVYTRELEGIFGPPSNELKLPNPK